ncbi:MAG: hypothetical protein M1820_003310 [Bogoriella megaspora]|nr:MAG: hypothetical protein M1820_003310 [Bogoriella megaspora]
MASNASDTKPCVVCQKPTTKVCPGCKDAPKIAPDEAVFDLHYCSTACQKADWQNHEDHCNKLKQRRILFQAAGIIQSAFYVFSESASARVIVDIVKQDNTITVVEDLSRPRHQIYHPFPNHRIADIDDRNAVLSLDACTMAVAFTTSVAQAALTEIAEDIREVDLEMKVKSHTLKVLQSDGDGGYHLVDFIHEVLRVQLKGGETFCLDIAGAQFGGPLVTPYNNYVMSRTRSILGESKMGSRRDELLSDAKSWFRRSNYDRENYQIRVIDAALALKMDNIVAKWESTAEPGHKLGQMCGLSAEAYGSVRDSFLDSLKSGLEASKAELVEKEVIWRTSDGRVFSTPKLKAFAGTLGTWRRVSPQTNTIALDY